MPSRPATLSTKTNANTVSFNGDDGKLRATIILIFPSNGVVFFFIAALDTENEKFDIRYQLDLETAIFRVTMLSYIPVGFWSRVITRLLAEDAIVDILRSYFNLPISVSSNYSN